MNPDVLNFFSKLSQDNNLKKQFLNKPFKKKYSLALENSEKPFTKEEFMKGIEEIYKNSCIQFPKNDSHQKLNENNLDNISGGKFSMVDIANNLDVANLRDAPKDFKAFYNANTDDKFELLRAVDDLLNGGAIIASSIHGFIKKYKAGSKTENLKELQNKHQKMKLLLEQAKLAKEQSENS